MELSRKSSKIIREWYRTSKKALLVKGARQVGKTYLIRSVLSEEGADFFEINLIRTPGAISVLKQAGSIDELIMGLSTISEQIITKGRTVVFIDEVQRFKEIVTKIKFWVDDGSLKFILSGSLLGVELKNIDSAPVGYLSTHEMYPLDFEEFLQTAQISRDTIESLRKSFENRSPVMDAVNEKMMELFTRYLMVGGMPEAVSVYAETKNINKVMEVHRDIARQYKLDFTQYEEDNKKLLLTNVYDLIPAELLKQNRRFIISDLKKGLHYERNENTFLWLRKAGVAIASFNATEPRIPLKLNEKQSLFKLFLSDVGILTSIYGMATKNMLLTGDSNLNAGGIYENVVATELISKGFCCYYYNSNRLGELDFVVEYKGRALPIEVKSGKDYTIHSALNNCLNNPEYEMPEGIVFANCNVEKKGKVTYLPIYMIMFLESGDEQELILS